MSEWALSKLVLATMDVYPSLADPAEIASIVAGKTPASEMPVFYEHLLRDYIASRMRQERNAVIHDAPPEPELPAHKVNAVVRSAKLMQRRSWFQQLCASRISVAGNWRLLGECTADDLLEVAAQRRKHAEATLAMVTFYNRLYDAMRENGARIVADLPDSVAEQLR